MRMRLAAWICGVLMVQCLPVLPSPAVLSALAVSGVVLWRSPRSRLWAMVVWGVAWSAWRGAEELAARLPLALEGATLQVVGEIADFPTLQPGVASFVLRDVAVLNAPRWPLKHRALRLAWYSASAPLAPGQHCALYVRLKQPRGLRNFHGFDAEKWLFATHLAASGYVVAHPRNACTEVPRARLQRLRVAIAAAITRAVPDPALSSILSGLAVGARAEIAPSAWQLMRDTGVLHLISVSGLHVGMVAIAMYSLSRLLLAGVGLCWPSLLAPPLAAVVAMMAATGYALLAGFALPTQRTLVMLGVAFGSKFIERPLLSLDSLLIAAAGLLLMDPMASLTLSFWLSFGAIALAIYLLHSRRRVVGWHRWWAEHFLLAALLSPLLGYAFQAVALATPLANMLAVPLVTLVIVPLLLVGSCLIAVGFGSADFYWQLSGFLWERLWLALQWIVRLLPPYHLPFALDSIGFGCVLLAILVALLPLRAPRILLVPALLGVLWLAPQPMLRRGVFQLDMLDVGQGLSVVITTAEHVLVYDAGASFPGGGSIGSAVVVPFLRALGHHHVDTLMISHADNDHAGGAAGIVQQLPVDTLITNAALGLTVPRHDCRAGVQWQWDGVQFEVLHPVSLQSNSDNDGSCVLRITGAGGSVLLTGDVEALAERELLARHVTVRADIVIAPHHGSQTSSTAEFVAAVAPSYAWLSTGYRNRFHHPSPRIVARYRDQGAFCFNTSDTGGVRMIMDGSRVGPQTARGAARRYWDP